MKKITTRVIGLILLLFPSGVFAQGFGEYGRAVGSVPHGSGITGSGPSGGGSQGGIGGGGVGDVGGRAVPVRLTVVGKNAGLFPRQDDESEKIALLSVGENLVPMIQSEGGSQWYMVKTQKGLVGWVKSVDVKQESKKN
jgi:hypothetical protein